MARNVNKCVIGRTGIPGHHRQQPRITLMVGPAGVGISQFTFRRIQLHRPGQQEIKRRTDDVCAGTTAQMRERISRKAMSRGYGQGSFPGCHGYQLPPAAMALSFGRSGVMPTVFVCSTMPPAIA